MLTGTTLYNSMQASHKTIEYSSDDVLTKSYKTPVQRKKEYETYPNNVIGSVELIVNGSSFFEIKRRASVYALSKNSNENEAYRIEHVAIPLL